jgi:hypothetical protein
MFRQIRIQFETWFYAKRPPVPIGISPGSLQKEDRELAWDAFNEARRSLNEAKGRYNSKVYLLPKRWRMIYTLLTLDSQVNNGGFHQFFTNAGGVFDEFLVDDLRSLGQTPFMQLVETAFDEYRGVDYRDQWENRGKSWDYFTAPYKEGRFRDQEKAYYKLKPGLTELVGQHVRQNFTQYSTA